MVGHQLDRGRPVGYEQKGGGEAGPKEAGLDGTAIYGAGLGRMGLGWEAWGSPDVTGLIDSSDRSWVMRTARLSETMPG